MGAQEALGDNVEKEREADNQNERGNEETQNTQIVLDGRLNDVTHLFLLDTQV